MNGLFECIRDNDYQSALDYYSDEFFEVTPRGQWVAILEAISGSLGNLEDWELQGWQVTKREGVMSGTYVEMTYRTKYSACCAAEEVTLKKSGSEFRVTGHHIDSEGCPDEAPSSA